MKRIPIIVVGSVPHCAAGEAMKWVFARRQGPVIRALVVRLAVIDGVTSDGVDVSRRLV